MRVVVKITLRPCDSIRFVIHKNRLFNAFIKALGFNPG
jgi:hypothetical protein